MSTANRRRSRTRLYLIGDSDELRLSAPDVVPALEPLLRAVRWTGHPVRQDVLTLGPARWPSLKQAGIEHLGAGWRGLPTSELWAAHVMAMASRRAGHTSPGSPNLLDLKAEIARREAARCRLCAVRCLARRDSGERGACGAGSETRCFSFEVLSAEEPGLGRGAAPRLAGCNASCTYCSRPDGIPATAGDVTSPDDVRAWLTSRAAEVDAIHWIGGNVDQELSFILDVMRGLTVELPVIWNHNATATPEITVALLEGVVDVYLPDLRYGPGPCADETGAAAMSFAACTACIEAELRQDAVVAVRHLALPGHVDCCSRPVLTWLAQHRDRVFVSLLGHGYIPSRYAVADRVLGRPLNAAERASLDELAVQLGLRRVS